MAKFMRHEKMLDIDIDDKFDKFVYYCDRYHLIVIMLDLIETYENNPHIRSISLELKSIKDITQMVNLLSKFRNLRELSLHGNRLNSIPPLSSLQRLTILDISNNPIKIDNVLLDRLFQLPCLEHLIVDSTNQERETIIEHLPKLKSINREYINREAIEKHLFEEERAKLSAKLKEEMDRIKEIYYRFNQVVQNEKRQGPQDQPLSAATQSILRKQDELTFLYQDIEEEMAYFYQGLEDKLSCDGVFAYCKNKLTTILDGVMIRLLDQLGLEQAVKIYEEISRIKTQNFDNVLRVIFTTSYEKHISNQVEKPTNRIRKQNLYLNEIFRMKKTLSEVKQQNKKIDRLTSRELQLQQNNTPKVTPRNKDRNKQGFSPLKKSQSRSLIKSQSKPVMNRTPSKQFHKQANETMKSKPTRTLSKSPSNTLHKQSRSQLSKVPSKMQLPKEEDRKMSSRGQSSGSGNKIQSLQQLLSLIQEILDDKAKYNNKHFEKKEPYETCEQFLFSFFSRKYGLKEIALDWCLSTIRAVQKFCKDNIEVEVFGKILKSHLYEQYYDQCKQFKGQIASAFRRQKVEQQLNEVKFKKIFTYFFSYQKPQIVDRIMQQTDFPISADHAEYFLQSYKLSFEQKQLRVFKQLFEKLDKDNMAYLTQNQCRMLAKLLVKEKDISEEDQQNFMKSVEAMLGYCRKDKYIFSEAFQIMHTII